MFPPLLRLFFVVAALAVINSPLPAAEPATGLPFVKAEDAGIDAEALAKITKRLELEQERGLVSGVVALAAKDGKIFFLEATGRANIAEAEPMSADSIFAIASMTKPITATAIMILQDEGKLNIDDPVSKYIPSFKDVKLADGSKPTREITIRDLMTHTSGLVGDQQCKGTLEETAEMLAERPLGFQPGSKWQYSPGLNVCGRIVEIVSEKPYDEFLAERIFEPLGMKDTSFAPPKDQRDRIVKLYKPGDDPHSLAEADHWINDLSKPRAPNPSGGLFSTASDLARFYQAMLNGGEYQGHRILSEKSVKEMTQLQTGDLETGFTPGCGWGLGFYLTVKPQGITRALSSGSFGHGGAFGTQGWIDPEKKMIFVLMIQRTGFGNSDGSQLRGDFQELAVEAAK